MNRIFATLLLVLMVSGAVAQEKGYRCTYAMDLSVGDQFDQIEDDAIREAIVSQMQQMKMYYTLTYAGGKSLFTSDESRNSNLFASQGSRVMFADYGKLKQVCQEEFLGRTFLIEEDLKSYSWKIGTEKRQIAGRTCTKATLEGDEDGVVAWFSAETPIPSGPMGYWGLPGLIVRLEQTGATYTLTEIKAIDNMKAIAAPSKGKKVSREDYNKVVKEKMEQLGVNTKSGSGVQIIQMN